MTSMRAGSMALATRERILREASELFASRGYAATTTRAIADAVGVKQPGLFYHFKSKAAIMEELLSHSLTEPTRLAVRLVDEEGSPATRLYAYLRFDLAHILGSPYKLVGLDSEAVLLDESFAHWRTTLDVLRSARRSLIQQAVERGEFVEVDPELINDAITGLILGMIQGRRDLNGEQALRLGQQAADLALRAVLREPSELSRHWDGAPRA